MAEYVIEKHGLETIELKWGQGAKCIGGEIKVDSLERALELQKRGYIVTPDPSNPVIQAALQGRRHQGVRAPQPPGLHRRGRLPGRVRAAARPGLQARSRSRPAPIRLRELAMAHQVGQRGQDRPADHRRRPRRHRHEPLADDGGVGHARPSTCTSHRPTSSADRLAAKGEPRARPGLRRRLQHRGPHLQGPGPGRSVRQGRLHGPGADDPRHGRQEHRPVDEQRRAAQDGQPVRQHARGDLRLLGSRWPTWSARARCPTSRWAPSASTPTPRSSASACSS